MTIYRRIYEQHHGPIPKDNEGRTYDIHHIDGNRKNNDPSNLVALSIDEHYKVHYDQGDYSACLRIIARKDVPSNLLSELATKENVKRIENGTHHFCDSKWQSKQAKKRVDDGSHNLLGGDIQRLYQRKRVSEGTHHCLGPDMNNKRVKNGTHPFLGGAIGKKANEKQIEDGTHPFLNQKRVTCPHCGKEGNEFPMKRWHFDKCKDKK